MLPRYSSNDKWEELGRDLAEFEKKDSTQIMIFLPLNHFPLYVGGK